MKQDIWKLKGLLLSRQVRRAQLTTEYLKGSKVEIALDIGCAEGYVTRHISELSQFVVGIDIDAQSLMMAKRKTRYVDFAKASIHCLPFKERSFDAVCILEVLEHLPKELQRKGVDEADAVLKEKGVMIISIPEKEKTTHGGSDNHHMPGLPFGHLHTMDTDKVTALLPTDYGLDRKTNLPNVEIISCSRIADLLPLRIWLILNKVLGRIRKGYWIILKYEKSSYASSAPYYQSIKDVKVFSDHYRNVYEKEYSRARAHCALSVLPSRLDGKQVLDLGCGGGFYSLTTSRRGCADIILVDISRVCVKSAKMSLQHQVKLNSEGLLADVTNLPFRDMGFDLVLCMDLIEHVEKDDALLLESRRVLRNNGLILLSTQNARSANYVLEAAVQRYALRNRDWMGWDSTHLRFYTPKRLLRLLIGCGFVPARIAGTYFAPYLLADGLQGISQRISGIARQMLLFINRKLERAQIAIWRLFGWGIIVLAVRSE